MTASVATRVGDKVPESFKGRAFAVHRDACYLRDEDGRQLVLLDDATPPAPHGINVVLRDSDDWRQVVARDSRAQLQNGVLTITGAMETRAAFALADATLYEGRLGPVSLGRRVEMQAAAHEINSVLEVCMNESESDRLCRAARRRIKSTIDRLAMSVAVSDGSRSQLLATGLIGFGQGKANGDAALVGFLAARTALDRSDAGVLYAIEESSGREVEPSWGFLEAAAQGHFCEPLRSLAEATGAGRAHDAGLAADRCLQSREGWGPDLIVGLLGGFAEHVSIELAVRAEA